MGKDRLFAGKKEKKEPFRFNREVADVFDDMLNRSVPFYGESIRRQAEITSDYYQDKSRVYDLGCSNGNLGLLILDRMKDREFTLIGVDSAMPMIEKYAKRLRENHDSKPVRLVCGFLEDVKIQNASVVLINLTLQFIDLQTRFYKKFKLEHGYSELEISRKREALENVLCPDTVETHEKRLRQAGFESIDLWLKWFNFASFIAVKK